MLYKCVRFVSFSITSKALFLMRMSPSYLRGMTLWILLLWDSWPIECAQGATNLHSWRCDDGMHWLDGCSRICAMGGYISGNLEGGWMGDNLECFGDVLGLFLVLSSISYNFGHIHAWWAVMRVHDVGSKRSDTLFCKSYSGGDWTLCMAIVWQDISYRNLADISPNDHWNVNGLSTLQ